MQLSVTANPETGHWDVAVNGDWFGDGPEEGSIVEWAVPEGFGSARYVAVWLDSGERFTVAAIRPRGAKGQDADAFSVELPDNYSDQVFDPRLSTEYDGDGVPRRCGIELWLGEDPASSSEMEGSQRPLRIGCDGDEDNPAMTRGALTVRPLHAHLGSTSGIAVYLLLNR